jgi:hypothetical protein
MANALIPGTLFPTAPATTADLTGSMAQDMINAFAAEWPNAMGNAAVPASTPQMELMFVAIAQGVIKHLQTNAGALSITVTQSDGTQATVSVSINVTPTPPQWSQI